MCLEFREQAESWYILSIGFLYLEESCVSMGRYRIFKTEEFDRDYAKLDKSEQERVDKILDQPLERGGEVGKPLSGLSFFREKKFDGKRLYYLVYSNVFVVLALAISGKKAQQAAINQILLNLAEYQQYVFETLKKRGII